MVAQLISQKGHELIIQVTVNISGSLLNAEERIQQAVNEVGCLATQQAVKQFDTDGSPILTGDIKWTQRTISPKRYQTLSNAIKRLMVKLKWNVVFIKPPKAERFIVRWNTMPALSGMRPHVLPSNCPTNTPR